MAGYRWIQAAQYPSLSKTLREIDGRVDCPELI